jgi:hypothetical protein
VLKTETVNMTHAELAAWLDDPRHLLASTATGLESLRRLADGEHRHDDAFAAKVDGFNLRHALQMHAFGAEVGGSGYSKRHIALKNWGHDPAKRSSTLYGADRRWLELHPGAAARRRGRVPNPPLIVAVEGPTERREMLGDFAAMLAGRQVRPVHHGSRVRFQMVAEAELLPPYSAEAPLGDCMLTMGTLRQAEVVGEPSARFAAELERDLVAQAPGCACAGSALRHSIARAHHRDRRPVDGREPNPSLWVWLLPAAQLIVGLGNIVLSYAKLREVLDEREGSGT